MPRPDPTSCVLLQGRPAGRQGGGAAGPGTQGPPCGYCHLWCTGLGHGVRPGIRRRRGPSEDLDPTGRGGLPAAAIPSAQPPGSQRPMTLNMFGLEWNRFGSGHDWGAMIGPTKEPQITLLNTFIHPLFYNDIPLQSVWTGRRLPWASISGAFPLVGRGTTHVVNFVSSFPFQRTLLILILSIVFREGVFIEKVSTCKSFPRKEKCSSQFCREDDLAATDVLVTTIFIDIRLRSCDFLHAITVSDEPGPTWDRARFLYK